MSEQPQSILILGGGAIGSAIARMALERFSEVKILLCYRRNRPALLHSNIEYFQLDAFEEAQYSELITFLSDHCIGMLKLDWIINTIGLLHDFSLPPEEQLRPEKRIQDFKIENFNRIINANVVPTALAAKHLARFFARDRAGIFASISARVGSISDNRLGGWHSYRASKSCLNMMLKNISIEWALKYPSVCVLALHPGTTDSALSKPFQKNVPENKLFTADQCANYLLDVISTKSKDDSGSFYDWNNQEVLW